MGAPIWPPSPPGGSGRPGEAVAPLDLLSRPGAPMDVTTLVQTKARAAREAAGRLALCSTRTKNEALLEMARGLEEKTAAVLDANRADLERTRATGATRAFLDRLTLTDARIETMAAGLREIAALPDPVGE